jgi:hypothetical protein
LGNLNSGLQIYRLKYDKPERFDKIKKALQVHFISAEEKTGIDALEQALISALFAAN